MMAHQVAGRAVRASTFLAAYDATDLPKMGVLAAAVSILFTLATSRLLARFGPARIIPAGFLLSALLHALGWRWLPSAQDAVAVVIFLHISALGAVLLSGFWSLANEAFDPGAAKRRFGQIALAGAVGGICGSLLSARLSDNIQNVLLLLAVLHLLSAVVLLALRQANSPAGAPAVAPAPLRVLRSTPHLQPLAVLVILGTATAAMVDYLFLSGAAEHFARGTAQARFFSIFYGATQLLVLIPTALTRWSLEKRGISRTMASLPVSMASFAGLGLIFPAFPVFAAGSAIESILRRSLFRSGYELHYTPVSSAEKRVAKTIIDVGCDRAGDAVGFGLAQLALSATPGFATSELLGLVLLAVLASAYIAMQLDKVYTAVIERRLVGRAIELKPEEVRDATTMSALLPTASLRQAGAQSDRGSALSNATATASEAGLARLRALCSADMERVLSALAEPRPLSYIEAPQAIRLLAWDEAAAAAGAVLQARGERIAGLLSDHLLDPEEEIAVRRRLPRILARIEAPRAGQALIAGLGDDRFEVRYQCARVLDYRHRRNLEQSPDPASIHAAVERELSYAPIILGTRRLLDQPDPDAEFAFLDEEVLGRADKSLELIFSLLATVLPREPLTVAFRAFHGTDPYLKGSSVEYMETVLTPGARTALRNYLKLDSLAGEPRPSAGGAPDGPARPHTATPS